MVSEHIDQVSGHDATGYAVNRRRTDRAIDQVATCSDPKVWHIVYTLMDQNYWRRFHHSICSDYALRRFRPHAVTLPQVKFIASSERFLA